MRSLRLFIEEESGQDLVEYSLLAAFIAISSVAALKVLGPKIAGFYNTLGNEF